MENKWELGGWAAGRLLPEALGYDGRGWRRQAVLPAPSQAMCLGLIPMISEDRS